MSARGIWYNLLLQAILVTSILVIIQIGSELILRLFSQMLFG